MAGAEYTKYLQSRHWQSFRLKAILHYGKKCMMCGIKEVPYFHVHHLTYVNLGHEKFKDVVVLCEECHNEIHRVGFVIKPVMKKVVKKKFVDRRNKRNEKKKPRKKKSFNKIACIKEWAAENDAVMPKFPKQKLSAKLAQRGIIRL